MPPRSLVLVASALILTLLAAPTQQPAQTAQASAPTLRVYSRETIVDVTVTDSKGNPVRGLTRDDFTVKEDGKPQPIRSFEEFSNAVPPPTQPHPKLPPNVYTNLQPSATGPLNILLLDGLNTAPPEGTDPNQISWSFVIQTRVKQGATKFLDSMPAGTRVAVLGLSTSLRILQGITTDPALLAAAINTMDMGMDGRATTMPAWGQQQDFRNKATLEALGQIAADVSAIKGKKNLIWFSAGFPTITDPRVNAAACNGCLPDYTSSLQKAYGLLAAAQVAVYPVGAQMLLQVAYDLGPGPLQGPTSQTAAEDHLSFESMAEATGGAAFYNSNDLASLVSQAVDRGANYYTLSYVPPGQKFDYSHHSIKISVDKPGLNLVYHESYDAVDPATIKPTPGLTLSTEPPKIKNGNMQAAMSRSMPTSQQILFDVQVEPSTAPPNPGDPPIIGTLDPAVKAKLKGKSLSRYSFQYAIPASQFTFTPGSNNTHHGSVELDLAAFDTDGKLVTGLSQIVTMPLSDARFQKFIQGPFHFFQQLDLPPGQFFLRIGVLDRTSNKVGTLEIPLTVPKKAGYSLTGWSPPEPVSASPVADHSGRESAK